MDERQRTATCFGPTSACDPTPGPRPCDFRASRRNVLRKRRAELGTGRDDKARPVAGDEKAGLAFLDILRPFMWRRSLDFAAIQDNQSIKRQINAYRGGAEIAVAGHNIKLGRGGIREIEFLRRHNS